MSWLYVLPALLVLAAVMGFPIIRAVLMSFQRFTLNELVSGNAPFVGIDNYARRSPTRRSRRARQLARVHGRSIALQFSIGLGLALLFGGGVPAEQHISGPDAHGMADPVVVTGTLFLWMFNVDYGVVNFILQSLHIISEPIGWTVDAGAALPAVIIANVWLGIPFNLIMLSAAMAGLPSDIYEAATVDGASSWQKVRHLTVPLLRPAILGRTDARLHLHPARLRFSLDAMTKGGPGNATEVCRRSRTDSRSCTWTSGRARPWPYSSCSSCSQRPWRICAPPTRTTDETASAHRHLHAFPGRRAGHGHLPAAAALDGPDLREAAVGDHSEAARAHHHLAPDRELQVDPRARPTTGRSSTSSTISYLKNSIIIATATMVLTLLLAIPAAYALARFRLRGARLDHPRGPGRPDAAERLARHAPLRDHPLRGALRLAARGHHRRHRPRPAAASSCCRRAFGRYPWRSRRPRRSTEHRAPRP